MRGRTPTPTAHATSAMSAPLASVSETKCALTAMRAAATNTTIARAGRARGHRIAIGTTRLANSATWPDGTSAVAEERVLAAARDPLRGPEPPGEILELAGEVAREHVRARRGRWRPARTRASAGRRPRRASRRPARTSWRAGAGASRWPTRGPRCRAPTRRWAPRGRAGARRADRSRASPARRARRAQRRRAGGRAAPGGVRCAGA